VSKLRRLYDRLDGWARDLSRGRYAAFVGAVSFSCYVGVGTLLGEPNFPGAFGTGITLAVLFFAFDANDQT
jgi:hypothetical protein